MMTADKLQELARLATAESPMTRVALDDLADPARLRRVLQVEYDKHARAHEGINGLVDRIRRVAGMDDARARRIARTEKTKSSNGGRFAQLTDDYLQRYQAAVKAHRKRPELPLIEWIDPKTAKEPRHHHVEMTGTAVRLGDRFPNGLRFPGDPDAPVEEVVNCHCYFRRKAQRASSRPGEPAQQRPRVDQQPAGIKVAGYTIKVGGSGIVTKPQQATSQPVQAVYLPVYIRSRNRKRRISVTGRVQAVTVQGSTASIALALLQGGDVITVTVSAVLLTSMAITVGQMVTVTGRMADPGRMEAHGITRERS